VACLDHKVEASFGIVFNVNGFGSCSANEVKGYHFFAGEFDGTAAFLTASLVVN